MINLPNTIRQLQELHDSERVTYVHDAEIIESALTHLNSISTPDVTREYLTAKIQMCIPVMQEARDAITALTLTQARLHGISLTLADRMDKAGTYSVEDWRKSVTETSIPK